MFNRRAHKNTDRLVKNPSLNFDRPCYFSLGTADTKGKILKNYPQEFVMTPYQRLRSLPDYKTYLVPY